jgi:hypothetical protein
VNCHINNLINNMRTRAPEAEQTPTTAFHEEKK